MAVDIKVVCPDLETGTKIKNEISITFVGTKAYNNSFIITDVIKENDNEASFNIIWHEETFDKHCELSCHDWYMGYILGQIKALIVLKEGFRQFSNRHSSNCSDRIYK